MLYTFLQCRQKARFSLDRWEPAPPYMGEALMFGDMFHYFMEKNSVTIPGTAGTHDFLGGYHEEKVQPNWNREFLENVKIKLVPVWHKYLGYWEKADAKFNWESVEKVFDVEWNGFRLRGKIDAVLTFLSTGERWLLESKTKGQINEDDLSDTLNFDLQNTFYLTAMQVLQQPALGVIYNVIRNPQHKNMDNLQNDLEKTPAHFFKRYEVRMPQETLSRCQAELLMKLEEFKMMVEGTLPVYRNETACTARGVCPYLKACSQGNMIGYAKTKVPFRELLPST